MSNKRDGRNSTLSGGQDGTGAKVMSPERLAEMGYNLRDLDATDETLPSGAIVPHEDGTLETRGVIFTAVGVELPKDTSYEQWEALTRNMLAVGNAAMWALGDLLIFAEHEDRQWGVKYQALAAEYNYEIDTLYHYASLCRKVKFWIRNPELSPSHHRAVTRFAKTPELQRQWLTWAATGNHGKPVTLSQMRQAIKEATQKPPTPSDASPADVRKVPISRENRKDFNQFLKLATKAGQGDSKAKERALGKVIAYRKWLDEVEAWLLDDSNS